MAESLFRFPEQVFYCSQDLKGNGYKLLASVAQLDSSQTGDQKVVGTIPTGSGNILSWRLIMKYFLH